MTCSPPHPLQHTASFSGTPPPPLLGDNHCLSEKWSPQENFHKPPLQVSYLLCHSSSSMLQLTAGQQRCTRQPQAEPSEITGTSPASCQVSSGSLRQQQKCWTQLCETRSWFQPPTHLELRKSTWGGEQLLFTLGCKTNKMFKVHQCNPHTIKPEEPTGNFYTLNKN